MLEWGLKSNVRGREEFKEAHINGRPSADNLPPMPEGHHSFVIGFGRGKSERVVLCHDLGEMQALYDRHTISGAKVKWYTCDHGGTIQIGGNVLKNETIGRPSKYQD